MFIFIYYNKKRIDSVNPFLALRRKTVVKSGEKLFTRLLHLYGYISLIMSVLVSIQ